MKVLLAVLVSGTVTVAVQAQAPAAPAASRTMVSASDVAAMIAKAKAERKDQPNIAQSMIQLAPYNVSLEYRASVGPAAVHETEAELFYVVDGSATLTFGPTRSAPAKWKTMLKRNGCWPTLTRCASRIVCWPRGSTSCDCKRST